MYCRLIDAGAIRARRAAADLTLKELAHLSDLSVTMLKYVEAGDRELSDRAALRVAKALGCHSNDFTVPKPADQADSEAA